MNAAMAYGTDGGIAALGLVALTDPEGAVAIYQPAPTVRGEVFDQYPELADILNPVVRDARRGDALEPQRPGGGGRPQPPPTWRATTSRPRVC